MGPDQFNTNEQSNVVTGGTDEMGQPLQPLQPVQPEKKSSKGLVIGLVVGLVLALVAGAFAIGLTVGKDSDNGDVGGDGDVGGNDSVDDDGNNGSGNNNGGGSSNGGGGGGGTIGTGEAQKTQRNAQRKNDLSRILTAMTDFQSNNNGTLPFSQDQSGSYILKTNFIQRYIDRGCSEAGINVRPTGCGGQFKDPDGTTYMFAEANTGADVNPGVEKNVLGLPKTVDHTIYVAMWYSCGTSEGAIIQGDTNPTVGSRMVALLMVLEGGGIVCVDNQ